MLEVDDLIDALEVYGNKEGTEAQLNETTSMLGEILECIPINDRVTFLRLNAGFVENNQEDEDE